MGEDEQRARTGQSDVGYWQVKKPTGSFLILSRTSKVLQKAANLRTFSALIFSIA